MNLEFVEVWEQTGFGHREKKFINPALVEQVIPTDSNNESRLIFANGRHMHIEGSPAKTIALFSACSNVV